MDELGIMARATIERGVDDTTAFFLWFLSLALEGRVKGDTYFLNTEMSPSFNQNTLFFFFFWGGGKQGTQKTKKKTKKKQIKRFIDLPPRRGTMASNHAKKKRGHFFFFSRDDVGSRSPPAIIQNTHTCVPFRQKTVYP